FVEIVYQLDAVADGVTFGHIQLDVRVQGTLLPLVVTKTVDHPVVNDGDTVTYTISIMNPNPLQFLRTHGIMDGLPAPFATDKHQPLKFFGGLYVYPGATQTFSFQAVAHGCGTYTNHARVIFEVPRIQFLGAINGLQAKSGDTAPVTVNC